MPSACELPLNSVPVYCRNEVLDVPRVSFDSKRRAVSHSLFLLCRRSLSLRIQGGLRSVTQNFFRYKFAPRLNTPEYIKSAHTTPPFP